MLVISLLVIVLFSEACKSNNKDTVATILMDTDCLLKTKEMIKKGDTSLAYAFKKLIKEADKALKEGPYSVTYKEQPAPSGDKCDYASYSRYWWPDSSKVDGLPYIRKDGETNPNSQSLKKSDRPRIGKLGENTETLGLAYYLTGERKYAKKAAELLRVWFIDETTRMNPNLNHAQCRLGHNTGSKSGVLDGRLMIKALEGSLLISNSSELSESELMELKVWAKSYFEWLTTNELALQEAKSKNNHGSFYDAQAMYFALYSGNDKAAKQIAQNFISRRVLVQIQPDGSMPEEIARTRSHFYSIYNLHAMFIVAHLAEKVNVDIWQTNNSNSRLKAALDYLVPYTDPKKQWPFPTIDEADRSHMLTILQMANRIYNNSSYITMANKLPLEKRRLLRSNLAFPLMR